MRDAVRGDRAGRRRARARHGAQTNADRPLAPGEVRILQRCFFERGRNIVKSGRTSLVIDPPDGRIPALTPTQRRVDARTAARRAQPGRHFRRIAG